MRRCGAWFGLTFLALVVLAVLAAAVGPVALVLMAVAPSVILLTLVEKYFRRSVTKCQMAATFMEAVLWMVPLMVWIILYGAYLEGPLGLKEKGVCAVRVRRVGEGKRVCLVRWKADGNCCSVCRRNAWRATCSTRS